MGAFAPQDEDVRNEIRTCVDVNMCVEAGAGTGKTTVLVDRIVHILKSGSTTVDHLAVITFTEKAAAELAARVRRGLERAHDDPAVSDDERERIAASIRGLNAAHIETIHAFAAALLRERPVEARLDPGFEVLADLPAQLSFESAYDDWITEQMAIEPPPPALVAALNLGLRYNLVREAAERLNDHRDALPLPPYADVHIDVDDVIDFLGDRLEIIRRAWPAIIDVENTTYTESQRMDGACAEFAALRDHTRTEIDGDRLVLNAIAGVALPDAFHGKAGDWRGSAGTTAKNALKDIKERLLICHLSICRQATANLVTWLQAFPAYYGERRKRDGTVDFNDLLIWARDLVRDSDEVRAYFADKYRCILVDEFQDTDPMQAEIVVRLCAKSDAGATNWRALRPRLGSLFVVGDPKQSIYRFRGADITMYDDVTRHVFDAPPREITQNFRSVSPVIAWVNAIFGNLINEREGLQPRYLDLVHLPALAAEAVDAITIVHGMVNETQNKARAMRRAEGASIASLLRREVGGGSWRVRGAGGALRAATWRDVVILIPSRTELPLYEEALAAAEIPHRHEGGRQFFERQEVRELTSVLRAIDDSTDAAAIVAALRSPAYGCSDEELFLYRSDNGRFDYLSVPDDVAGVVPDALRSLRGFAAMRHTTPLPEIIRAVLDTTRLVEFAMLQPQGEQTAANLLKMIDQARAFSDAQGGGLRGFVRWIRQNVLRAGDETDASVSEESDDVVRILTIHASKGLEFPIVVFANMNGDRRDATDVIIGRAGEAPALHMKLGKREDGFVTPGFEDAETLEHEHKLAEEKRLLYVAATRAKDRLVVPLLVNPNDKPVTEIKSLNGWLRSAGAANVAEEDADIVDTATLPALEAEPRIWRWPTAEAHPASVRELIETREAWQSAHRALVDDAATPYRIVTATSLKAEWERSADVTSDDAIRRGRATEFGTAVHELLEKIDLSRPQDIPALATAIAAQSGLNDRADEIEQLARNTLASDVVARALRSRHLLREVPFTAPLPEGDGLAEGRIDLLFEEDSPGGRGIVVVDFKTDAVRSEREVDERAAHYRNQALVYTWAAHRATSMPVREVVFLFARIALEHNTIVDDAFMAEAEALMRDAIAV